MSPEWAHSSFPTGYRESELKIELEGHGDLSCHNPPWLSPEWAQGLVWGVCLHIATIGQSPILQPVLLRLETNASVGPVALILALDVGFSSPHLKSEKETSLVVQWSRRLASIEGVTGLIPGQGTKILHAVWWDQKEKKIIKGKGRGTSLVAQWLRLQAPNAGGPGSLPGQGTKTPVLQLRPGAAK